MRRLLLALLLAAYAAVLVRLPSFGSGGAAFDPLSPRGREVERAIEASRFSDALPVADDLWSTHPGDPTIAFWRAEIFRGLDRARDEAAAWEDYLRLARRPDAACPALGLAYARAGDPVRSIEAYKRCSVAAPDDPERWLELAGAYGAQGRSADATEAFRRADALDPSDPRIPRAVSRPAAGEDVSQ